MIIDCSRGLEKFSDVLACAAPLIFCDTDGENPFFGGTCFRTKFDGRVYVITARHCITNSDIDFEKTRVECAAPERAYLPLKSYHLIGTRLPDTDHSDIAILEADLDRMDAEDRDSLSTLDLSSCLLPNEFKMGHRLVVEGFPYRLGNMNYEERRWIRGSQKLEARYEGPAENELATSKLSFVGKQETEDLDGISGAPVFAFKQAAVGKFDVRFAGMMIRARYFINADIIIGALKWVIARQRNSPHNAT
jgi:hypothetical protein